MRFHLPRALTASLVVTAALIISAPTAFAGSDGQQIIVDSGASTQSVKISGDNQIGEEIHQTLNTPTTSTSDSGYWWKGTIKIVSYSGTGGSGSPLGSADCDVPVSQGSNWYTCDAY